MASLIHSKLYQILFLFLSVFYFCFSSQWLHTCVALGVKRPVCPREVMAVYFHWGGQRVDEYSWTSATHPQPRPHARTHAHGHRRKHNGSAKVTNPKSERLFGPSEAPKPYVDVCAEQTQHRGKTLWNVLCVRSRGSFKVQRVILELIKAAFSQSSWHIIRSGFRFNNKIEEN